MDPNKVLAARYHSEILQRCDLAVADEIIDPRFKLHSPGIPPEMTRGCDGVKRLAAALATGSADLQVIDHDLAAERDKVLIRWTLSGTHGGDLFGLPRSGRSFSVNGIDLFRIAESKIAELWQSWDQFGLFQQLGAILSPAPL